MKRLLAVPLLLTVLTGCSNETAAPPAAPTSQLTLDDLTALNGGEPPHIEYSDDGSVKSIFGCLSESSVFNEEDALGTVMDLSGILGIRANTDELVLFPTEADSGSGFTSYQFLQYYEGMQVYGSSVQLYAEQETGLPCILYSSFVPGIAVDTEPEADAESAAAVAEQEFPHISNFGEPELKIFSQDGEAHLVWFIRSPGNNSCRVFVDAHTGTILYTEQDMDD